MGLKKHPQETIEHLAGFLSIPSNQSEVTVMIKSSKKPPGYEG